MTEPTISAIIPARNAAETLEQTLDSLLAQSVVGWEALIIDDGSTDATGEIIARYVARDPRFVALSGPERGVAAARNVGIAAARGAWLHFLDADDWVVPAFYARLLGALGKHADSLIAYCNYHRVYPGGLAPGLRLLEPAKDAFEEFSRGNMVSPNGILVDRKLVVLLGGFDESLAICEDWYLWQLVSRIQPKWLHVDEFLVYYRVNPQSLSAQAALLLPCSKTVIERGFAVEPRVARMSPARAGAPSDERGSAARAFGMVMMWTAGMVCGAGGRARFDRDVLAPFAEAPMLAPELAGTLVGGVMRGALALPSEIAVRWGEFAPGIADFFEWLAECWEDQATVRAIAGRFERMIIDFDKTGVTRLYGGTLAMSAAMAEPVSITPPPGVDRVDLRLRGFGGQAARLHLGVLGGMTAGEMRDLLAGLPLPFDRPWLRRRDLTPSKANAFELAKEVARDLRAAWRRQIFRLARPSLQNAGASADVPVTGALLHAEALAGIIAEAAARAETSIEHAAPAPQIFEEGGVDLAARQAHFDKIFETPDPWNYGSAYEREKYERQIALLPDEQIANALELACAEGHFTRMLAPRVEKLIAADVSPTALARAAERCADLTNVDYLRVDLGRDELPGGQDLIVCSEMLYYLADQAELARATRAIAGALRPGGCLVTAHPYLLCDDKTRTGFDWDSIYGVDVIYRALAETPGLVLEATIQTELYRIDRFRRAEPQGASPKITHLPVTSDLDVKMARHIVWGGAVLRRQDVARRRASRVPVLIYHGVSATGPAALARYRLTPEAFTAQMKWLRANGFHTIGAADLALHLREGRRFQGRPVMLTFDDGFQDFADTAWPILQAHDFTAEMYVVTDYAGKAAVWDADKGTPTPLMDPVTIIRLAGEGALFGSHGATHRPSDGLTSLELAGELANSRAMLERWLGRPPAAFAAPYAITDGRVRHMAAACGYEIGFGGGEGPVHLRMDPLDLPRILVRGDKRLEDFIQLMNRF
jgi:peptidoglycan/xylan/chitin deacetylase (PgdA/CDA1 family)/predicted TPR repeat methyltransferase